MLQSPLRPFSVIVVCIYTLCVKKNLLGLLLFQFRSDLLQISDHAGPTFSAQDRNHFILSRAPRRNRLSQSYPPLLSNSKFHTAAPAAAIGLNQTFALQGPKVAHQRRAFHTQPFTQFRHAPSVFSLQSPQNRRLCGSNTKAANFRVKEPRHRPRNPAQVETHAILHRRHIQFLRHDVYIHNEQFVVKRCFAYFESALLPFQLFQHSIKELLGRLHLSLAHQFRKLLHLFSNRSGIASVASKLLNPCFYAREFFLQPRLHSGRGVGLAQLLEEDLLLRGKHIAQREHETELLPFDVPFPSEQIVQLLKNRRFVRLLSIQQHHHRSA